MQALEEEMDMKLKLGDRVSSTCRLHRRKVWKGRNEWYRIPGAVVGVFVGWRTYANGIVARDEEGNHFEADEWIKVALICQNPRHNPIPVPYDECEVINV